MPKTIITHPISASIVEAIVDCHKFCAATVTAFFLFD